MAHDLRVSDRSHGDHLSHHGNVDGLTLHELARGWLRWMVYKEVQLHGDGYELHGRVLP